MKFLAAVGISAALLFVTACSSDSSSSASPEPEGSSSASPTQIASPSEEAGEETPEAEPTPEIITYADVVSEPITTAEICTAYSDLIDQYTSTVAKRTKSLDGKAGDPYRAAKFVGNNGWVYEDLSVDFNNDWEAAATGALNAVSNGQARTVDSLDDYREASLDACGLATNYSALESDISGIDRQQSSVVTAAENKPWYPKGFDEWQTGVAFKHIPRGGDCYGCYYWAYDVVTEDGCPSGLYVEISITDSSDRAIDWTNDTLSSLKAGQKGRLVFRTYNDNANSFDVTEINCR